MEQAAWLQRRAQPSTAQRQNTVVTSLEAGQTAAENRQSGPTPMQVSQTKAAAQNGGGASKPAEAKVEPSKTTWQDVKGWYDDLRRRYAEPVPPPAPAPPPLAPEFWDDVKNRDMTGRQVANTIAQEFRDVKPAPGVSTWNDIEKAEQMDAHTILNADRKYGPSRMRYIGTATDEWRPWFKQNEAGQEQYQRAVDAARKAFQEVNENKADPTQGRFYFNNRYDANTGQRHLGPPKGGEWVNPYWQSSRFQWRNNPVYSLVYENPKSMPHTPEEQERLRAEQARQKDQPSRTKRK
jgi:hypothetical protein